MTARRIPHHGLTLLEVVLALAILAGSFAVLGQLVGIAVNAAKNSRNLTRAQMIAESAMSEIAAGILPAETINGMPVTTNPGWVVSADIQSTIHPGMLLVTVVTQRESDLTGRSQFVLTRWLRDPNIEIPEDPPEEESTDDEPSDPTGGDGGTNTEAPATPTIPQAVPNNPGGNARRGSR